MTSVLNANIFSQQGPSHCITLPGVLLWGPLSKNKSFIYVVLFIIVYLSVVAVNSYCAFLFIICRGFVLREKKFLFLFLFLFFHQI